MSGTVVCGIGNRMRGDDAIGPLVTDRLRGRTDAELIDCGESPESYLGKIEKLKPAKIIIVDAVEMDKSPGTVSVIDTKLIKGVVMSSHNMPMTLFLEYAESRLKAKIVFVGVQPSSTAFCEGLSPECSKAFGAAAEEVLKLINPE